MSEFEDRESHPKEKLHKVLWRQKQSVVADVIKKRSPEPSLPDEYH